MTTNEALETYPMQFRDKIDEYLWKEHHILGGCCSSVESLKYSIAREVAEKLTDAFIEKAAKWLEENLSEYCDGEDIEFTPSSTYNVTILGNERMIEDFKKAMKL